MNFFERQNKSRRTSRGLVALFALAVAAVVFSIYFAVTAASYIYHVKDAARSHRAAGPFVWFNPEMFCWVAGITVGIIGAGALLKIRSLSSGGGYVAECMGAQLLYPDTADPRERRLFNVVEEMSIASGVPVPLLYVMGREDSINAFAAGYDPASAVVAVTRGCLTMLSRDELQAVIAHEFNHILSGDMRLNIRFIGLLGGIMSIAGIGNSLMRGVRGRGSAPVVLAGVALVIIGYAGVFFGRIIQCAVSRQREFLADASAVQFTRNPAGLAGALKKIGGFTGGSRVCAPAAEETCHMFFARAIAGFFSTHPPLVDRIKVLEPGFRGRFQKLTGTDISCLEQQELLPQQQPISMAAADAAAVADSVGTLTLEQVSRGQQMLAGIPEKMKTALANPLGACAAVCCLLLDADPEKRGEQIRQLRAAAAQPLAAEFLRLAPIVTGLAVEARLPALDLALPALRQLSSGQYRNLLQCIKLLIGTDKKITLFEFCLYTILTRRLASALGVNRPKQAPPGMQEFREDAAELLTALAHAGHNSEAAAREAFAAGAAFLESLPEALPLPDPARGNFIRLGKALQRCAQAPAQLKQQLFKACSHCALHDSSVSASEAELLRAIAYCLDLPLPVFLPKL